MPLTAGLLASVEGAGARAAAPRSSGSAPAGEPSAIGAYGLRVDGLAGAEPWMQAVADDAPRLRVSVAVSEPDSSPSHLDERAADVALLGGGRLRARRDEEAVTFSLPERPTADELLHPYLAPAAALTWQWRGHEALHAGAVQLGDVAVMLFGVKEAGKSTTLSWLAREAGRCVLSDDLAVIVDGEVLAGPRSVDLRAASWVPPDLPSVRGGERARVTLRPAPASLPLGGSVLLGWGAELEITTMAPAERLQILAASRMFAALPPHGQTLLDLAALPMVRLSRPRTLEMVRAAGEAIIDRFAGSRPTTMTGGPC